MTNIQKTCCKLDKTPRERGRERMFHCCGCSAFIINLAHLIIDQNNAWNGGQGSSSFLVLENSR